MAKKLTSAFLALSILLSSTTVKAAPSNQESISPRANYGVQCISCGEYDYMKYKFSEQVGVSGTTFILYYECTKCGNWTTVTLFAR
ncbi:MAG: hypothetical protein ACI4EH_11275 [Oliverpabstia sp.]